MRNYWNTKHCIANMAQTLRALFGNLVLPRRDERVELYSKLGGALIGSMRKQRPDEARKYFLKRVKKYAARLMPHHLGFTWKCIDLEVFAHKVLVAWDDDKARQLVKDKHNCRDLGVVIKDTTDYISLNASQQSLVPEVCSVPVGKDMLHYRRVLFERARVLRHESFVGLAVVAVFVSHRR
jgi:hypothetical protein